MNIKLSGIIVPMLTPFREDESIDSQALRRLCDHLIASGVDGLFPAGSTGEGYTLERAEWRDVIRIVVDQAGGRIPIFAGIARSSSRAAIELAREAETLGADAVVLLTPYYVSPTQQELCTHFHTVAEATRLPLLPYNNPNRTSVTLTADTVACLAQTENIVGIKDSSGNLVLTNEFISSCGPRFAVFQGQDSLIAASLAAGAAGAVAATANVAPSLVVGLYRSFLAGDLTACNEAQRRVAILRKALQLGTFPVVFKEAMAMIGLPVGPARRPAAPLDEDRRGELWQILESIGLVEMRSAAPPFGSLIRQETS